MSDLARDAYVVEHRERICAWLRANNIDPDVVPVDVVPRLVGDVIGLQVYERNAEGKFMVTPDGNAVARKLISVSMVAEPGETVGRWLLWPAEVPSGLSRESTDGSTP